MRELSTIKNTWFRQGWADGKGIGQLILFEQSDQEPNASLSWQSLHIKKSFWLLSGSSELYNSSLLAKTNRLWDMSNLIQLNVQKVKTAKQCHAKSILTRLS